MRFSTKKKSIQMNTEQDEWNFKQGTLKSAITKICTDIYDGNQANVAKIIDPNSIKFCCRQILGDSSSPQQVATIYFIDSKKTIIIACVGSKTFIDWLSNFTQFESTNIKGVPDFIWNSSTDIYDDFTKHCYKRDISDYLIVCCGHSRGGGIASCLGYMIKSNHRELDVKVVTYACPAYATKEFNSEYCKLIGNDNIVNKLSIYDPIAALKIFYFIPGPVTFIELENYCENIVLGPLGLVGISLINSLYAFLINALDIISTTSIAQSFSIVTTGSEMSFPTIILNTLLCNFLYDVGNNLLKGKAHSMVYYELNENGPVSEFIKHLIKLLEDVKLGVTSILSLLWKGILLFYNLMKELWKESTDFIYKLFEELKKLFMSKLKIH
ncbi:hypothetical protein ABK040_005334 [Willaertia magna]